MVIKHQLDPITSADGVVDLGPAGGRILALGTSEIVTACPESTTGRYPWMLTVVWVSLSQPSHRKSSARPSAMRRKA